MKAILDNAGYITLKPETVAEGFALKYITNKSEDFCESCSYYKTPWLIIDTKTELEDELNGSFKERDRIK